MTGLDRLGTLDGVWSPEKVPTAYRYSLDLKCAVCRREQRFEGEYTVAENEGIAPFGVGPWRRFATPRTGHADPLAQRAEETVVCSKACFAELYDLI